jgi:cell division protein ZapA
MAQVTVTIAGRTYRMACGDGEEAHLEGLAALYDSRIEEMRRGLGELGDMRLHVMAALMIADELTFLKKRVEALEAETHAAQARAEEALARHDDLERAATGTIEGAAERLEKVARLLSSGG